MMGDWFKFDELKVKLDTMTDEEFVRLSGDAGFVLIPARYYTRPTLATRLFDWLAWRLMDIAAWLDRDTWNKPPCLFFTAPTTRPDGLYVYYFESPSDGWRPCRYV